jgi:cytochrome o ubiquinol oxidase subunit 2
LNRDAYVKLEQPSQDEPVHRYASVDAGLYQDILTNCVQPDSMSCMRNMKASDTKASDAGAVRSNNDSNAMAAMPTAHP